MIEDHSLVNDSNTLHITESNNNNPPKKRKVKKSKKEEKAGKKKKGPGEGGGARGGCLKKYAILPPLAALIECDPRETRAQVKELLHI